MRQNEYTMPLFVHQDGTLAVHGGDIRGLVVEADSFEELRSELLRLAPRLLHSNHGLSEEEIAQASLRMVLRPVEGAAHPAPESHSLPAPRVLWEDSPHIKSMAYG